MRVFELLHILQNADRESEICIDQFFDEKISFARSVDIRDGKVTIRDHHLRVSESQSFKAFDGAIYSVPSIDERMLR